MDAPPPDLDTARAAVAARGLVAAASAHLTAEVATALPFEALGPFKNLLKRFFSTAPWSREEADELSALVAPHVADGWWDHDLGGGLVLAHGRRADRYELWVSGAAEPAAPSLFERVFAGPVVPEATPHPRKVKFNLRGSPAPGAWYRRGEPVDDERAAALLAESGVSDVMVAGDFVTVGLDRTVRWEDRLDPILAQVTALFWDDEAPAAAEPARTRDELVAEGLAGTAAGPAELHLLDPDDPDHRDRLEGAAAGDDARLRRIAVATLAQSANPAYVRDVLRAAYADDSRLVRRVAIDAAADRADEALRPLLHDALADEDAWTRWKAVRALRDLGTGPSRDRIAALGDDPDFQVRMEVAAALRG